MSIQRNLTRLAHPMRSARSLLERLSRHENHPRYWVNPVLFKQEQERARSSPNVIECKELELTLDGFEPIAASNHIERLGCLLVRGNDASRAAIAEYRRGLNFSGYEDKPPPRSGLLTDGDTTERFSLHRLVQRHFYEMCRHYFRSDLLMSTVSTTATLRTVFASKGLVPFHQDISPVSVARSLTFWIAISPDRIGRDAPGLRFIASKTGKRTRRMPHDTDDTGYHETRNPGLREDEFFWTPEIAPGDFMIFDAYCCHSSHGTEAMTLPRTSVDVRFSALEQRQALSFLGAGHGLVLIDRNNVIAPI